MYQNRVFNVGKDWKKHLNVLKFYNFFTKSELQATVRHCIAWTRKCGAHRRSPWEGMGRRGPRRHDVSVCGCQVVKLSTALATRVASCCQVASPHAASLCTRMLANRPGVKSQEISVKSEWEALGDATHQ